MSTRSLNRWVLTVGLGIVTAGLCLSVSALVMAQPNRGLVLTVGGDINFNKSLEAPEPDGAELSGRKMPFEVSTLGIRKMIDGDINFANIETVVTDRRDLSNENKQFTFRTHPNAIAHLISLGFNLFSLANNHAYDYGFAGLKETLGNFRLFKTKNPGIDFVGIGENRNEVLRPVIVEKNGYRVAFAAISILDPKYQATATQMGLLHITSEKDFSDLMHAMHDSVADLKVLSVHFGTEMQLKLDVGQREKFNRALAEGDVDVVLGDHPHIVRPIEMVNGKLIIYSLGNYLMQGAEDLARYPLGSDYGLFGRLYFGWDEGAGRLKLQAMEVVPLTKMNTQTTVFSPEVAAAHVRFLNNLSREQLGARGLSFEIRIDGSGLACASRRAGLEYTPRAASICRSDVSGF